MKWNMKRFITLITLLILILSGCSVELSGNDSITGNNTGETNNTETITQIDNTETSSIDHFLSPLENLPINQFFEQSYYELMLRSPEYITYLGLADEFQMRNDMLNDLSDEFTKDTQQLEVGILELLQSYDRATLSDEDQISYAIYEYYLEDQIRGHEFLYYGYLITHNVWSYTYGISDLFLDAHPLNTKEDFEDYISRIELVEIQIDQVITRLENSESVGVVLPKHLFDVINTNIENIIGSSENDPTKLQSSNVDVFNQFVSKLDVSTNLTDNDVEQFETEIAKQVETSFIPAFIKLKQFLQDQSDRATYDFGVWKFPRGEEYYEYMIKHFTTADMSVDEIHQLGLSEVERITSKFWIEFEKLGYPLDEEFGTLIQRAMDEAGYFNVNDQSEKEAYIKANEDLIQFANDLVTPYFNIKPDRQVEIYAGDTGGYYSPSSADGSRPGQYHISINPNENNGYRPIMNLAPVFYHEGTPGHHFQISISQESNLPTFRKDVAFMGQIEGWALYAELIAEELGAYKHDPYGRIGMLQLELLRSARLVADTGIHAYGWTSDQAVEYIIETLGNTNWQFEPYRYAVMPAQALCYKIGQLKIMELRNLAEAELGDGFDIRDFHDIIIGNGNVPLDILGEMVLDYIEKSKGN